MKYLLVIFFLFSALLAEAQKKDLQLPVGHAMCPSGSVLPLGLGSKPKSFFNHSLAETNSEVICGRFKMIFEDISLGTGYGFDDPTNGQNRITTLCNVLTYVQSVIEIPQGDSTFIELFILESEYMHNNSLNPSWLAMAGPYEPADYNNGIDGFYSGLALTHITTGMDPDTNFYDGLMCFDFVYHIYHDDVNFPVFGSYCNYDLHGIALHEISHVLGFQSLLDDNSGSLIPRSINFPKKQYSLMDVRSLFYGDVTAGNFIHAVDSNTLNVNVGAGSFRENKLWLFNDKAPHNFGLFAGNHISTINGLYMPGHLNEWQDAFLWQGYYAPGYMPDMVMGPFSYEGQFQVQWSWSKFELKFLQLLGYQFKPSFLVDSTISTFTDNATVLNNKYAFTTKKCIWSVYSNLMYPTDSAVADFVTDNCNPVVIDLTLDNTLQDPNGDSISIFPGSLFNIRGCGIHGNNHDALTITPDGKKITFQPRADFVGRAQFGFDLFDGKERGQFIVYTIDVNRNDSCFNANGNLVINGDFEEGSEVATYANPKIENGYFVGYKNGKYAYGNYFIDGARYPSGVDLVRSSMTWCWNADSTYPGKPYGQYIGSFDYPLSVLGSLQNPLPVNNIGDRYCYYLIGQTFSEPLSECNKYRISYDITFRCPWGMDSSGSAITYVRLESNCVSSYAPDNTVAQQLDLHSTFNVPSDWIHIDTTFIYCSADSARFITMLTTGVTSNLYSIDNLSITKVPFSYSITPIPDQYFCDNDTVSLTPLLNDSSCSTIWNWQSFGNVISCNNCSTSNIFPVMEQPVIVTATVGNCPVVSDTINFYFQSPPPVIDLGNDSVVCDSASVILYNHSPVSPTTWFNGITSDSIAVNTAGLFYASTYDGCRHAYDSVLLSSPPRPAIDLGNDTYSCPGTSVTLYNYTPAFPTTWFDGSTSDSISVNGTGIFSAWTFDGCMYNWDTIQLFLPQPPVIDLGNDTSFCQGASVTLYNHSPAFPTTWFNGTLSDSISINTVGTFTATTFDGCLYNSDTIQVTVRNLPNAGLGNDTVICNSGSFILSAPPADLYLWSTGETTASIIINSTGTFGVTVTMNNCSASDFIHVNPYILHADTLESGFLVCEQSPVTLHAPFYASNVSWSTGAQTNNIQVNEPGTYVASFIDSVCPSSKSFVVTEYPFAYSDIFRTGDTLFASNQNMFIYQWYLNNELIQSSQLSYLHPIQQGNYHLQIIDSKGCVYVQGNHVVNNSGVFVYYHHETEELIIHGSWRGKMKVTLTDMLGQILLNKEIAESLNIVSLPLHSLNVASAYYFITLESDDVNETVKIGIMPGY